MRWCREGSRDALLIDLEPSLIARVAAEAFELDSSRTILQPLYGVNVPELRSAMLSVAAELRAGGGQAACSTSRLRIVTLAFLTAVLSGKACAAALEVN